MARGAVGDGSPRRLFRRESQLRHSHAPTRDWLRDVILGAQDGLVNILGIILGIVAAGGGQTLLLATGFAAAITESISMGAVGYTSTVADRDYYMAQRATEEAALADDEDLECQEITQLYREKGFTGELLNQVVATITSNRDRWLETILEEERHLQPVSSGDVFRSSVVITLATLIRHMIPLLPFVFLPRSAALVVGLSLSAVALFGVGAYQAITRVGRWWRIGLRMVTIGLGAAGLGSPSRRSSRPALDSNVVRRWMLAASLGLRGGAHPSSGLQVAPSG